MTDYHMNAEDIDETKLLRKRVAELENGFPEPDAPENKPVIVDGGIAVKRDGKWYTGMEEPMFRRRIMWKVTRWWPLPTPPQTGDE